MIRQCNNFDSTWQSNMIGNTSRWEYIQERMKVRFVFLGGIFNIFLGGRRYSRALYRCRSIATNRQFSWSGGIFRLTHSHRYLQVWTGKPTGYQNSRTGRKASFTRTGTWARSGRWTGSWASRSNRDFIKGLRRGRWSERASVYFRWSNNRNFRQSRNCSLSLI